MTPAQRKAQELYAYFYDHLEHTFSEDYSRHEKVIVKFVALKVCDEIIANITVQTNHAFWVEVRNAVESM